MSHFEPKSQEQTSFSSCAWIKCAIDRGYCGFTERDMAIWSFPLLVLEDLLVKVDLWFGPKIDLDQLRNLKMSDVKKGIFRSIAASQREIWPFLFFPFETTLLDQGWPLGWAKNRSRPTSRPQNHRCQKRHFQVDCGFTARDIQHFVFSHRMSHFEPKSQEQTSFSFYG